ncbi:MAG: hypothetical protein JWN57_2921 [Frankiales bacterium]|nr:hypothetical protein [Frankiales bacterium]
MTPVLGPVVRIQTRHVERLVLLCCDACHHEERVSTRDEAFTDLVGRFFDGHTDCATWVRLP